MAEQTEDPKVLAERQRCIGIVREHSADMFPGIGQQIIDRMADGESQAFDILTGEGLFPPATE